MIIVQVFPTAGNDAYRLLRHKVTHEVHTWSWGNKAKTRLKHTGSKRGYIEVGSIHGVLVAQIRPNEPADTYRLTETFLGRLTAWFENELVAINMQFVPED